MYFGYGILRANSLSEDQLKQVQYPGNPCLIGENQLCMLCVEMKEESAVTPEGIRNYTRLLSQIVQMTAVIPLRFGTLFDEEEHVRNVLRQNAKTYLKNLNQFDGKIEVELRVWWKEEAFQQAMLKKKRLSRWKKALEEGAGKGFDVVEFGKAISEVADQERKEIEKTFVTVLRPFASKWLVKETSDELQAYDGVFLVEKTKEEEFDQAVGVLFNKYSEEMIFKYSGPWAPHHFVEGEK